MNARTIVNSYLDAFQTSGNPMDFLAEDFQFDGPLLVAKSKAEFMKGMEAMGPMKPTFEMVKQFEDGDEVCSIYNFVIGSIPVLMVEWSVVKDGKISSQRLVYDTKAFENAITA